MTHITPETWTEYKGRPVNLIALDADTVTPGTLISYTPAKGWSIRTAEGKTLTRKTISVVELDEPTPPVQNDSANTKLEKIDHSSCAHPRTRTGRAACRAQRRGTPTS
jgi:hypothetical protein